MKYLFFVLLLSTVFLNGSTFANSPALAARIEGQIFDDAHRPLPDVYVELLNDVNSMLVSHKTDASGRFIFPGLTSGRFRVRAFPVGKDLLEETKEVEIIPGLTGVASDVVFLEFFLHPDKRFTNRVVEKTPEAIFAQDIPSDAKKLYTSGTELLNKKDMSGLADLEHATTIFPAYFDALSRLGKEYLLRSEFEKAYPLLLRAIDINPRSYSSYYSLGYAFQKMNKLPAAIKAIEACTILSPESAQAHLLLGTLLRLNNNFPDAEIELKKAKTLAKTPDPEIHWQLALLFNRLNRNKDAVAELEIFLKLSPDNPEKKKVENLIAKLNKAK